VRKALFLLKSAPYGTLRVTEGYRAALGTAAMGIETSLVLVADGVYAALRGQDSSAVDQPCVERLMEGLTAVGVAVHLHESSLRERGLDRERLLELRTVADEGLSALIRGADAVLTF
jgi:sulfur relay (sulfurtransferase) DsrF/TusC family protein